MIKLYINTAFTNCVISCHHAGSFQACAEKLHEMVRTDLWGYNTEEALHADQLHKIQYQVNLYELFEYYATTNHPSHLTLTVFILPLLLPKLQLILLSKEGLGTDKLLS